MYQKMCARLHVYEEIRWMEMYQQCQDYDRMHVGGPMRCTNQQFLVIGRKLRKKDATKSVRYTCINRRLESCNDRLITVLKVFHLQVTSTNMKDLNLPETYYNSLFYFF